MPSNGPNAGVTHGVFGRTSCLIQSGMVLRSCSILSSSFTSLGSCGMQLPSVVGICNLWAYAIENFGSNQDRSRAAIGAPRRRNGPTFFVCRQASSLLLTMTASATEMSCSRDVRFPPESDHIADVSDWQLCATCGLMHRSKHDPLLHHLA